MMSKDLQHFELSMFLEAILLRYGYDFRDYAKASLKRRIAFRMQSSGLTHISELVPKVLYDDEFFELFLKDMSITVTKMFRNPAVFKLIREQVFPKLRTYSRINIWHAGCATGEEVYSMAIMLEEEGLLNRSHIYATDYNNCSLDYAKKGIYPAQNMKECSENYVRAGGKYSFADYYWANFDSAKIKNLYKNHITFAHHNLMQDRVFAEMQLILCRNVLIYFEKPLQNKVLSLFLESLAPRGFLVLGDRESLLYSTVADNFTEIESKSKIYRKNNEPHL